MGGGRAPVAQETTAAKKGASSSRGSSPDGDAVTIKVTVSQARKLTATDIDGASDPYVVVFVKTEEEAGARRTKTIDDTLDPGR